jgi:hypothetical protein
MRVDSGDPRRHRVEETMAKFIIVTIMSGDERQQQAVNIEAITRYIPVKADASQPECTRIFLMGPAASEDRFECLQTFQELHDMSNKALAS